MSCSCCPGSPPTLVAASLSLLKLDVESAPGSRPTLGELYQSRGEQRAELRRGRRKVQALSIGSFIAYRGELPKRCRLGCITAVFAAESRVTVHAYAAAPDLRLRVTWSPLTITPECVKRGPGPTPLFATVTFDRIICDVPCSGDGTLRKNPQIWNEWRPEFAIGLHALGGALRRAQRHARAGNAARSRIDQLAVDLAQRRAAETTIILGD